MSTEQEQVQVRFTTQQTQYAVSEAAMLLPSNIKKDGLSEIVNNLLDIGKSRSRSCYNLPSFILTNTLTCVYRFTYSF